MKKVLLFSLILSYKITLSQNITGHWRFVLANEGGGIPFNMEIVKHKDSYKAFLLNATERLELETIVFSEKKDSIFIPLHIFDACLALKIDEKQLHGVYRKHFNQTDQNLVGTKNEKYRFFADSPQKEVDFSGKWAVTFTNTEGRSYPAIATINQNSKNGRVIASILTTTGDYRYLEGNARGKELYLSTFDGGFAFLFKARLVGEKLEGEFWSAKSKSADWVAERNPNATLPDASKITYLKEGYNEISFSFPDLNGKMVSLKDEKYKNKVVILQIFGSWCPNCMDETAFLAEWYKKNKNRPIAIIGLAYERKPEFEYARQMVQKVVKRFGVEYDFLIAGTNDKEASAKTLPMLNGIFSYPTTIFIDKNGKVRKIHTGFSGPATGKYYQEWREEFNALMSELLKE